MFARETRGIWAFLAIAFGVAWIFWEIAVRLGVPVGSPLFQLAALPGAFAPAIAAIVVRKWITREGFSDAGLGIAQQQWRYYLVALLLPFVVLGVIALEAIGLSIGKPDFSLLSGIRHLAPDHRLPPSLPPHLGLLIIPQLLITAIVVTPLLWGEEFGWRGYLQPRLFPQRPVLAAIVTGLIWGVWHYPLILRGYDFPGHPVSGALVFPVSTILLSIIFGWLKQRSSSIWSASLAHAATNAIGGSLILLWFYDSANPVLVSYLGILAWLPLGVLCSWIILTGRLKPAYAAESR